MPAKLTSGLCWRRTLSAMVLIACVHTPTVYAQDDPAPSPPGQTDPADPKPEEGSSEEGNKESSTTGQTEGEPDQGDQGQGDSDADDAMTDSPAREPEPPVSPSPGAAPEEVDQFERFNQVYLRYQKEIEDYRGEVNAIVESEYNRKRSDIEEVYDKEIRSLEALERDRRIDAIAALEEFLRKYPNNKVYTPDVIYRLAELYFEKANDEYLTADESFQDQQELYDLGRIADPPQPPERNYDRSIALFQRLITDFPEYRYIDGAYYLLGFCQKRMGQDEEARQAFVDLIRTRPDSKFVPEAWVRIGEHHFDYNELDKAIAAYSNALNYPDNTFYDKALYKLAWAYYRADRFDDAIESFKNLVRYADKKEEETGRSGSELREEAVQYLAISLAEEDWNGDGVPDDDFGMARVRKYLTGKDSFEPEVLARLGDIFFDNTRYDQAIETYRLSLERNPLDPDNPKVHDKLIVALLRLRRFDEAFEERRKTGVYYGPGSEWYVHQEKEGNAEALAYADTLARDNLIESATWYHEQAQ
ncbi:MAG: tetratricopeptide repeat protein, partial [Myxococcota bacterium]